MERERSNQRERQAMGDEVMRIDCWCCRELITRNMINGGVQLRDWRASVVPCTYDSLGVVYHYIVMSNSAFNSFTDT